jgi:outer membrane lipoprotein-sorting protein
MKSAVFSLFLLLLYSFSAEAQDIFAYPLNNQSRAEVTAITSRLASHKIIKASFTQTKEISRLSRTFTSKGNMIFAAERGLLWEVTKPFPSTTIITDEKIIQKSASGKISSLSVGDNDTFKRFSSTIQAIFKGDFPSIEKNFEIYFFKAAAGNWIIGLKPRDKTLRALIASIQIHGKIDLSEFILTEANGDTVTYRFSNITYPVELSPADEKAFF